MSDRKNFGYGQIVTETELDDAFNDLENADHNLADDTGLNQNKTTDTKDATVYGGILSGLTISRNGTNDYVTVAAGTVCDDSGRRVRLGTNATVKITNIGDTAQGVTSSATGDGAAITVTCGVGQYVVCSLFLVYDENTDDARTDALGTSYYFELEQSFHFHLKIGTAYTHPAGSAPNRASLEDGKVLLGDLILTNSGGAMQVVNTGGMDGILYSNEDWDDFASAASESKYADNTGRRSDWLSLDDATDFPLFDAQSTELRKGTARDSFYDFIKMLQVSGSTPSGADLIGDRVHSAVTGSTIVAPASVTLAAGSLHAKNNTIAEYLADCLYKGGDNVITTDSAADGGLRIYSQYDTNQMWMTKKEYITGNPIEYIGNYGELIVGRRLEEHWLYSGGFASLPEGPWSEYASATGGGATTAVDGYLRILAQDSGGASSFQGIELGNASNNNIWEIGTSNKYGAAGTIISFPVVFADLYFAAHANGVPSGAPPQAATFRIEFYKDVNNYVRVLFDFINTNISLTINGGGTSETETMYGSLDITKRYLVHFAGYPNGTDDGVRGFVSEVDTSAGTITKQTTVSTSSSLTLASGGYQLLLYSNVYEAGGTQKGFNTYCDYLYVAETAIKRISNA